MEEEVSTSVYLAIMINCTAALLSAVIAISLMGINIVNSVGNTYANVVANTSMASITDISRLDSTPAPSVYKALMDSIDFVDQVNIINLDNSKEVIFEIGTGIDELLSLSTAYRLNNVRVTIEKGVVNSSMYTITIEVIE